MKHGVVEAIISSRRRWELAAGATLTAAVTLVIAAGSFFDRDDIFFAEYFELNAFTPDALVRSWFGHLMPGYIASVVAFLNVFGLSWPAALVFIVLIHTGAFVAFVRILDATVGSSRTNVIAGLAFSLSLGPMIVRLWWAATLNNMLALAVGLAVLGCVTRWMTARRTRHLVAALILYALALALSEKNLLFSVHIAAWSFLVVWRGLPVRERLLNVLRTWPLWVALVVMSLIDVIAFIRGPYVDESGAAAPLSFSVRFVAHNIIGGLIPSLFGVEMSGESLSFLEPRVVIPLTLFVAFVIWTIMRVRSNAGVWLFAVIAVTANAAVLSRRGEMIGLDGARSLRYLLESTALIWLAIGASAVLALRAVQATSPVAMPSFSRKLVASLGIALCVALIAVSSWSWAQSVQRAVQVSGGYAARDWIGNLEETLPDPTPPLIDSPLPLSFSMPALHPYDMVGLALPSLGWGEVDLTTDLEDAWVVGADGFAGPARIVGGAVAFEGARCTDGSSSISIPEAKSPGRKFVIFDVSQASGDTMTLIVDGGWITVPVHGDGGRFAAYVPYAFDGDLQISAQGNASCVDSVTVADLLPQQQ